jgi:hypothetical protein
MEDPEAFSLIMISREEKASALRKVGGSENKRGRFHPFDDGTSELVNRDRSSLRNAGPMSEKEIPRDRVGQLFLLRHGDLSRQLFGASKR